MVTLGSEETTNASPPLAVEVTPAESVTVTETLKSPAVPRLEQVTEAVEPEHPVGSPDQV